MDRINFQETLSNLGFTVLSADKASDIDQWPTFDQLFGMITLPEDVMQIGLGETVSHTEWWVVQKYHANARDWFKVEIGPGFMLDFLDEEHAQAAYEVLHSQYPTDWFRILHEVQKEVRSSTVVSNERPNSAP